jgi:glycosyltransferase involved in cell wall biosynthesis
MDTFSKGIERRMEFKKGITKLIFNEEYERLTRYERQIFEYFEHHTIISEQDRTFILHPKQKEIRIISNGVSAHFSASTNSPKKYDLLFTGNMGYPPNVEAATFIYKEILPLFNTESPNCLIAGISPPNSLLKLNSSKFNVSGWVPDMRMCYASSSIFIAPMFIGTGLQNKLLEAMAMGIPCITTSLANKALKASDKLEILIADSAEEFVKCIRLLQNDTSLYHSIAQNGKNYILTNYSWEKINRELSELIRSK